MFYWSAVEPPHDGAFIGGTFLARRRIWVSKVSNIVAKKHKATIQVCTFPRLHGVVRRLAHVVLGGPRIFWGGDE